MLFKWWSQWICRDNISDLLLFRSHWHGQCLCLLQGVRSQWCNTHHFWKMKAWRGKIVSVLPPVTACSQHLRVPACCGSEVLPYRAVLLKFYPVQLGKWWRQFCFLLSGCQGQLSGLVLGRRGKTNHTRKQGIVVVSGIVATSFLKYWCLHQIVWCFFLQQSFWYQEAWLFGLAW